MVVDVEAGARERGIPDDREHFFRHDTLMGAVERQGSVYQDWQQQLVDAVLHLFDRTEAGMGYTADLDRLSDALQAQLRGAGIDDAELVGLSNHAIDRACDAIEFAAVLGYCLGRTAEPGIEDWDGWLRRALAKAALGERFRVAHPDEAWRRIRDRDAAPPA